MPFIGSIPEQARGPTSLTWLTGGVISDPEPDPELEPEPDPEFEPEPDPGFKPEPVLELLPPQAAKNTKNIAVIIKPLLFAGYCITFAPCAKTKYICQFNL